MGGRLSWAGVMISTACIDIQILRSYADYADTNDIDDCYGRRVGDVVCGDVVCGDVVSGDVVSSDV
jgi:hypothetical protein